MADLVSINARQLAEITSDTEKIVEFLQARNLVLKEKKCDKCEEMCQMQNKGNNTIIWRHKTKQHDYQQSIWKNTFFEGAKIPISNLLLLLYEISQESTYDRIIKESSANGVTTSRNTVADWISYSREALLIWLDKKYEIEGQIGGRGKYVEIDESKFGKRKYNKGRRIEGTWVLGMVEIDPDGKRRGANIRLEVCDDNCRNKETLLKYINKHIAKDTVIVTDKWKGYDGLEFEGYIHFNVNHEENFVDPETGANIQTIESQWRYMKDRYRKTASKQNFESFLWQYLWKMDVIKTNSDPFLHLLKVY